MKLKKILLIFVTIIFINSLIYNVSSVIIYKTSGLEPPVLYGETEVNDGYIRLNWTKVDEADFYLVYESNGVFEYNDSENGIFKGRVFGTSFEFYYPFDGILNFTVRSVKAYTKDNNTVYFMSFDSNTVVVNVKHNKYNTFNTDIFIYLLSISLVIIIMELYIKKRKRNKLII